MREGTFTDSYGKDSTNNAVVIIMNKDEFEKYNWQGLTGRPILEQFESSCETFSIHPGIQKEIDPKDIIFY